MHHVFGGALGAKFVQLVPHDFPVLVHSPSLLVISDNLSAFTSRNQMHENNMPSLYLALHVVKSKQKHLHLCGAVPSRRDTTPGASSSS
jgi:hypothetical protein